MEWQDILEGLIELVEQTAPKLWELAIKQVMVETLQFALIAISLIAVAIILFKLAIYARKQSKLDRYSDWDMGAWFSWIGLALVIIAIISSVNAVIGRLINPEFYAIRLLINYVK